LLGAPLAVGCGDGVDGTGDRLARGSAGMLGRVDEPAQPPESTRTDDSSARNAFPSRPSCANRCRRLLKRGQFDRSCSFVDLVLVRRGLTLRSTLDITGM
jgi:hypothetical protein